MDFTLYFPLFEGLLCSLFRFLVRTVIPVPVMTAARFEIPPDYQDRLRYREASDDRSDTAVLVSLTAFREVVSEKNVSAF